MADGEPYSKFFVGKDLMIIFSEYPYFNCVTDSIGETTLVKWIADQYKNAFNKNISKQEVLGFLHKIASENIITRKSYGSKVLVSPTRNFFLVKQGKDPIKVRTPKDERMEATAITVEDPNPPIGLNEERSDEPLDLEYSYKEYLIRRITSRPDGYEREIIRYLPNLYSLACNILKDEHTDWHTKIMISTALGYCILEDDIFPDYKERGYIDDLFILSYVLRESEKHVSPNIITDNWDYEEDIMKIIDTVYTNTYNILGKTACDVLHQVGLWKFKKLELEEYQGSSNEKVEILRREKHELLAMTAYLVKVIYHADVSKKDLEYIKQYLKTYGDYDEINRIVLIASQGHELKGGETLKASIDEDELGNQLQKAVLKTLLEN